MLEVLSRLHGDYIVAIVFLLGGFGLALCIVMTRLLVDAWLGHRDREVAAAIIEDMVQQGMSADEIERVLLAAGFNRRRTRRQVLQHVSAGAEPSGREG